MQRLRRGRGRLCLLVFALLSPGLLAAPPEASHYFRTLLAEMHSDYYLYVGEVREGPTPAHPAQIYMGVVRPGGADPTSLEDAPLIGQGVRNDIVVYRNSQEPGRGLGWAMLLIDHEYFHARHLSRGDRTPVPSFASRSADRHFFEAAAWGYNLRRAEAGAYPTLTHADYREAFRTYSFHFEAFRDFVLRHDRPAWAHYERFLPDPAHLERMLLAAK